MLHVGDITKLRGAELPPVDIVCGGSPCQDLSIAGLRAGLAGARSGLFMEQLRVIREELGEENPVSDADEMKEQLKKIKASVEVKERIRKEIEKAQNGLRGVEQKLSNEKFVSRAPEVVVNAEREKAAKYKELIAKLEESAKAMQA